GALAGGALAQSGMGGPNLRVGRTPLGPANRAGSGTHPVQARRMDAGDIADLRRWHRQAVARSLGAGYDLVYVYAAHGLSTLQHFLSRRYNDRDDAYGGSLENRPRLLRELLEDPLDAA